MNLDKELLITIVQSYPTLWDVKSPLYCKANRNLIWTEIAKKVTNQDDAQTVKKIKNTWENLVNVFRRNMKTFKGEYLLFIPKTTLHSKNNFE